MKKLAAQTFHSCPPSPTSAIRVFAMIPTALSGDRLPALAPLATISAVRNGGIDAAGAIAKASGAISATLGIAPGPAVETRHAATNMIGGSSRARPLASAASRPARLPMVPFPSASENSSVTPASVTKSEVGKPAMTASGARPAYVPTIQASGMATRPTFNRDAKLMTMAASRASSDASAGLMCRAL